MSFIKAVFRVVCGLFLLPAVVSAQCNEDLITVTGWTAEMVSNEHDDPIVRALYEPRVRIGISVKYNGDRPIRMIDGAYTFRDALGGNIGSVAFDRDLEMHPGEEYERSGDLGIRTYGRLLDISPEDVTAGTCINGVVYADGEVVSFR